MKSNVEWQKWGKKDPLWAVASWPGKDVGGLQAWTDGEFYALGESDWQDFASHWKHYGVTFGHCVEIGCGAGRITLQLTRVFEKVTGLDVSPDQVDYAKARVTGTGAFFAVTDGSHIPLQDGSADAVFSTHVFQHFDESEDAIKVLREVYRVLAPGGTLMIHMPLLKVPNLSGAKLFNLLLDGLERLKRCKAAIQRRRGKLIMRMLWYETNWLTTELHAIGFSRLEYRSFGVRSNNSIHDFVFATKGS